MQFTLLAFVVAAVAPLSALAAPTQITSTIGLPTSAYCHHHAAGLRANHKLRVLTAIPPSSLPFHLYSAIRVKDPDSDYPKWLFHHSLQQDYHRRSHLNVHAYSRPIFR
jgi:hypothetical protein